MKASQLSLNDLTFLEVSVIINPDYSGKISEFDFDGALFTWGIRHGKRNDDGTDWWVGLEIGMKSDEDKPCPYNLNIRAAAMFGVDNNYPPEKRECFIYENGTALIYGAIREMVMNITSRSAHGSLMLPTASFFGSFAEHLEEERQKTQATEASEHGSPD